MTKLAIKQESGYSMTTVLNAVDYLETRGLISCDEVQSGYGGKPHSSISPKQAGLAVLYHTSDTLELVFFDIGLSERKHKSMPLSQCDSVEEALINLLENAPTVGALAVCFGIRDFDLFSEMLQRRGVHSYRVTKEEAVFAYSRMVLEQKETLFLTEVSDSLSVAFDNGHEVKRELFPMNEAKTVVSALSSFICGEPISDTCDYQGIRKIGFNDILKGAAGFILEKTLETQ